LEFIERQNKMGVIKQFVIAKTTEENFQEISSHIRNSREIFMLAIVNKIDAATSAPPSPSPSHVTSPSFPPTLPFIPSPAGRVRTASAPPYPANEKTKLKSFSISHQRRMFILFILFVAMKIRLQN
jgi:hypothetical protein